MFSCVAKHLTAAVQEVVTGTVEGVECLANGDVRGALDKSLGHYTAARFQIHSPSKFVALAKLAPDTSPLAPVAEFLTLLYKESDDGLLNADLDLALFILYTLQKFAPHPPVDGLRLPTDNNHTLGHFRRFLRHATAAYDETLAVGPSRSTQELSNVYEHGSAITRIDTADIVKYDNSARVKDTPYIEHYLSVDKPNREIILAVRGTSSVQGAMTDLNCVYQDWESYKFHKGILQAALHLYSHTREDIRTALAANDDFRLVTCGHSLGGGVASVVAIFLSVQTQDGRWVTSKETVPGRDVHCYALESAASMCSAAATRYSTLISTLWHDNDIIPSLSHGTFQDLKKYAAYLKQNKDVVGNILRHVGDMAISGGHSERAESYLMTYRRIATSQRLVPPGTVFWVSSRGDFVRVHDLETTFREPRFVFGCLIDHRRESIKKALDRFYLSTVMN